MWQTEAVDSCSQNHSDLAKARQGVFSARWDALSPYFSHLTAFSIQSATQRKADAQKLLEKISSKDTEAARSDSQKRALHIVSNEISSLCMIVSTVILKKTQQKRELKHIAWSSPDD